MKYKTINTIIITLIISLIITQSVNALGVVHKAGTNITWNNQLIKQLPDELKEEINIIVFDYKKGNNKYCGYYTFWYNNPEYIQTKNIIRIWCKEELVFWHEIGHHIEQKKYCVKNLSEEYAEEYAENKTRWMRK